MTSNRVAVVTGASRGIGRATALAYAREGAAVVVNYRRNEEASRETVDAIRAAGGEAVAIAAELGDGAAIDRMFDEVRDRFGRVDVLVANAAATAFKPLLDTREHHVARTFGITVNGFLRCVQRAVELMGDRGGAIVAVSGFDSMRAVPLHGALGAAKAAMESMVRSLAVELAPRKIRVNAVNPGFIETDSSRFYAGPEYETRVKAEWTAKTPAGRLGTPDEVADVITFLTSERASFVYGQTLIVDGGLTLL
jgi:enoyl-[acyl-carrier protein] reductase III